MTLSGMSMRQGSFWLAPKVRLEVAEKARSESSTSMDDPRQEPLYDLMLGMVLWGETREEVMHRLEVNGITGERAEGIYSAARRERLMTIRGEYGKKARLGVLLSLGAMGIFSAFWFGLGILPRLLLYICAAMFGIGLWKWVDGVSGWLMAGSKEGPVSDEI